MVKESPSGSSSPTDENSFTSSLMVLQNVLLVLVCHQLYQRNKSLKMTAIEDLEADDVEINHDDDMFQG